jgi:aminopeptidase YwaD
MYKFLKYFGLMIFGLLVLNIDTTLAQTTSAEKISTYVKYLADDKLEGRYPGTKGNEEAADYIINFYKSIGINPLSTSGYKQKFQVTTGLIMGDKNSMSFDVLVERPGVEKEFWKKQTRNWVSGTDFLPVRFSDNGSIESELAFVGFGVTSKELNYDDYKDIDVKDKIVIILTDSADGKPMVKKFDEKYDLKYKLFNAREHGAKGVIFVKMQSDSANVFSPLKLERLFNNTGVIAVQASRTSISALFPRNQNLYPVEKEIIKNFQPKSFILPNVKAKITVDLKLDSKEISNVIALVEGNDKSKSEEYFIIGAHYDHLGWGAENSQYKGKVPMIHNGADDNASGTAGVMELAERFKKNPLRRPLIIMNFNAEEMGLLGSANYIKNPIVPKEKTVFMLNLDMIGRLKDNKMNVFGTGTSSGFSSMVDSLANLASLNIIKSSDGFAPSDHSTFYAGKIPVLFLFTGVHNDYHTPHDDWDKINFDGIAKTADYAEMIIRTLDSKDKAPDFQQAASTNQSAPDPSGGRHSSGVWFGIMPNFEEGSTGMKISGASAGSPAQEAGFKADDVIIKFGNTGIKNLYDLTTVLKDYKPGDKVIVTFIRAGKEQTVEVNLRKR